MAQQPVSSTILENYTFEEHALEMRDYLTVAPDVASFRLDPIGATFSVQKDKRVYGLYLHVNAGIDVFDIASRLRLTGVLQSRRN